jgi:hypothetical protein
MTDKDRASASGTGLSSDDGAASVSTLRASIPDADDVFELLNAVRPYVAAYGVDELLAKIDLAVATGVSAHIRAKAALERIAEPPTKNGFQEMALWMQRTAKDALV